MRSEQQRTALATCWVVMTLALALRVDGALAEEPMKLILPEGLVGQKASTKAHPSLAALYQEHQVWQRATAGRPGAAAFRSKDPLMRLSDGYVVIDAVASGDPERLRADLERLGMKHSAVYGRMVSGGLPITAIKGLESLESLKSVRPAMARTRTGSVTSQGDVAMRSDQARAALGIDGSGVIVGVLSDSFDCLGGAAAGVASGDLPAGINVVQEISDCAGATDEGRAMMEIIHDVAPGATLAFHTAFDGQADFAQGILDLKKAGAKVIVDDVGYIDEPMFQDGIIAQAVDRVVARRAAYFSAAGNDARQSYQSRFRPSGRFVQEGPNLFCEAHDFDPGSKVDVRQRIRLPAGGLLDLSFQWDQPFFSVSGAPGAASDLDILVFDAARNFVSGSTRTIASGDPVEFFKFQNPGAAAAFNVMITNCSGRDPQRIKYVDFENDATFIEFDTRSATAFGHPNARGAEAVGAADYLETPEAGVSPPLPEVFSSAGGVPIRLNADGSRKRKQELRKKPGIVAPDGTDTTFFGTDRLGDVDAFPNFFGTSAAAPHAAGVAALILQNNPSFVPNRVYQRLRETAIDMGPPGFDFDTGFGFIDAALAAEPTLPPTCIGVPATITGSSHSDIIIGTRFPDIIVGGGGNDDISGGDGNDIICGDGGRDTLKGGNGRDRMDGGKGRDFCDGGPGRDSAKSCETRVSIPRRA
jgi:subtilisin family serine protease